MADEVWPVIEEALRYLGIIQQWVIGARLATPAEKDEAERKMAVLERLLEEHRVLDEVLAKPTVEPEPSPFDQRARQLWAEYVEPYDDNLWEGSYAAFVDELRKSPLVLVERNHAGGRYAVSLHEDTEGVVAEIGNEPGWQTCLIVDVETGEGYFAHAVVKAGGWQWP